MAYTRSGESGHYIWGGYDFVDFDCTVVGDDAVDVFLYKLYEVRGADDDEFWQRHAHGKRIIENYQKGFCVYKHSRHSERLSEIAPSVAVLADKIWREHFTPFIGAAQVEYMLAKFQSAEQIVHDIKKNWHVYYTAAGKETDELIGYCAIVPKDGYLQLSKLYVRKDARGRGVSRAFLEETKAFCRMECGFDRIQLCVNRHNAGAIAVYRKWGFETLDSVKTDIGGGFVMDDYVMELAVPKSEEVHG